MAARIKCRWELPEECFVFAGECTICLTPDLPFHLISPRTNAALALAGSATTSDSSVILRGTTCRDDVADARHDRLLTVGKADKHPGTCMPIAAAGIRIHSPPRHHLDNSNHPLLLSSCAPWPQPVQGSLVIKLCSRQNPPQRIRNLPLEPRSGHLLGSLRNDANWYRFLSPRPLTSPSALKETLGGKTSSVFIDKTHFAHRHMAISGESAVGAS